MSTRVPAGTVMYDAAFGAAPITVIATPLGRGMTAAAGRGASTDTSITATRASATSRRSKHRLVERDVHRFDLAKDARRVPGRGEVADHLAVLPHPALIEPEDVLHHDLIALEVEDLGDRGDLA